jgi:hypothetical protein
MSSKEVQRLVKEAECQGWIVSLTKKNHYKWLSPIGKFFFSASTPSDHRAIKNLKQDLMRYGFVEVSRKGKNRG